MCISLVSWTKNMCWQHNEILPLVLLPQAVSYWNWRKLVDCVHGLKSPVFGCWLQREIMEVTLVACWWLFLQGLELAGSKAVWWVEPDQKDLFPWCVSAAATGVNIKIDTPRLCMGLCSSAYQQVKLFISKHSQIELKCELHRCVKMARLFKTFKPVWTEFRNQLNMYYGLVQLYLDLHKPCSSWALFVHGKDRIWDPVTLIS